MLQLLREHRRDNYVLERDPIIKEVNWASSHQSMLSEDTMHEVGQAKDHLSGGI